ncbi:RNA polymerase sigma-70 factor (ECF subfamily) [Saonia flava]|uniref:RNA polymerase sigma-70 factor (ECF subfamily) n=1 Tax=Saonia flava TaxID=523696 RepID=A0A846QXM6_9FLAO|nr:RNA polymerase sigma factor [Saonia flava]NJB71700.1 RNA polymerase sigma-70 factor (ECF subfamily) [Saonia flava]
MVSEEENYLKLNTFFKEEYSSLKGYVRSRINNTVDSDAEDIIQDVALRVFSRPIDALPINNIAGFVYNSIRNKIIDVMRTRKEKLYGDEELESFWTEFAELFYGKSDSEYPEHLKEKLKHAIMDLKPAYRDIILAVDFEGYTYREIAQQTGISAGTLMSRRHRAISLLFKKLEIEVIV